MDRVVEKIQAEIELMQKQREDAARQVDQAIGAIASLNWTLAIIQEQFPKDN